MAFHEAGVLRYFGLVHFQLLHFLSYLSENICYGLVGAAADAVKKGMTRLYLQFNGGHTRAILPAVMLLFHEQVQLVKAIHDRTIFLKVKRERFSQPDKCKPAFMFDLVAHTEGAKLGIKLKWER